MEKILIALLTLVPGIVIKMVRSRVYPEIPEEHPPKYNEVAKIIILSLIVLVVNIVILYIVNPYIKIPNISKLSQIIVYLDEIKYLTIYIIICAVSTIIVYLLVYSKHSVNSQLKIINKLRSNNSKVEESKYSTIWVDIFENREITTNAIVSIWKGSKMVSIGMLEGFSQPRARKEFKLIGTNRTRKDYEMYPQLLEVVKFEYYDVANDLLIKFHDGEKLFRTWQDELIDDENDNNNDEGN
jgi:NADH:ubiquinone oxidoreductase subunit 5 (subunit L)/multisubunit Na+/H+ antiporter MnhA subunit